MVIIRDYVDEEGILGFDSNLDERSTYEAHHLETLIEAERSHFWFSSRREKVCRLFQNSIDKSFSILEIGGGTGFIAEKLIDLGYTVQMADIHRNGLRYAKKKGIKNLFQFDLFHPPFENEFDVICLFDVLEHLKDESLAFKCLKKMLRPGGKIILTVPAHRWLWSRDDTIAGHERRYTRKSLKDALLKSHFQPVSIRYFFTAILPLLLVRRFIRKDDRTPLKKEENIQMAITPLLNRALHFLTKAELYFEKFFPNVMGGSLIAVAQMKES